MEVKQFNRYLVFGLVVNGVLMLSAVCSLFAFRNVVKSYRPKFPVSNEEILDRVSVAAASFLTNYFDNMASSYTNSFRSASTHPRLLSADFSVSSYCGRDMAYYMGNWYSSGDFVDFDGEVLSIRRVDFDRQRLYCVGSSNDVVVVVAAPLARQREGDGRGRGDGLEGQRKDDGTI